MLNPQSIARNSTFSACFSSKLNRFFRHHVRYCRIVLAHQPFSQSYPLAHARRIFLPFFTLYRFTSQTGTTSGNSKSSSDGHMVVVTSAAGACRCGLGRELGQKSRTNVLGTRTPNNCGPISAAQFNWSKLNKSL